MNPILFTLLLLSVFSLLSFYIYRRFITHLHIQNKYKNSIKFFLYFNLLGILLYAIGRYFVDFPNYLYFLFSLPIGLIFLLFCTAIFYDVLHLFIKKAPIKDKRREFFKKSLDISSLAFASAITTRSIYEARTVVLERVNIKIKKLKKPYKIIQLSDIHIGGLIDAEFIKSIVERVNKLDADLVVITGDLVDIKLSKAHDALEELKKLNSGYGTFFIVGNHEYFHDIGHIIKRVKELGIRVLENENYYIGEESQGFNLVGVYDIFGYRANKYIPDLFKALQNRDTHSPTILLAHQPKFLEFVGEGVDLMLSGHTHGGQLLPFKLLVKLQQPYISGLHQHTPNLQIYVNKGTGFWGPPMRLGASAEITEITIS